MPARSDALTSALIGSDKEEQRRLDGALDRVMRSGQILPTTEGVLRSPYTAETRFDLSTQDSIVYASVVRDFGHEPEASRCFLNRNSRDFADPEIRAELAGGRCKLLTSFAAGLGYIASTL